MKSKIDRRIPIFGFIFLGIFIYIYLSTRTARNYLNSNTSFSIAEIYSWEPMAKSSSVLNYYFVNNDLRYESRMTPNYNEFIKDKPGKYNYYIGKRFLVKYSKEKPKYSELLWDKPIPDNLQDCMGCSWDIIPF